MSPADSPSARLANSKSSAPVRGVHLAFDDLDPADHQRRHHERQRVNDQGDRPAQQLDQAAADRWACDERGRAGGAEQAVGLDVLVATDQRDEERLIRGLKQHLPEA